MPHVEFPQTICRAGVARRDVTPPVGIYHRMWGAATHEQAEGVHRPLTATALALAPSIDAGHADAVQVVVAVDHCLLWNREMDALTATVATRAGLRAEQIHVAFSHTHAAGLMDPRRASLPGGEQIRPYLTRLADQIGDAMAESVRQLRDATIVYGQGQSTLAAERDFWDEATGQFVCGFNPKGLADDTVVVARVCDSDGGTLATLVNYACHPTTLAWDNRLISPDYVGAMREVIERATAAPCVFLQGASGDLGPVQGYVGDVEVADRNGRQLGYAALAAIESLAPPQTAFEYAGPVVSGATIGTWKFRQLTAPEQTAKRCWTAGRHTIELNYRPGLPSRDATEADRLKWQAGEQSARAAGELALARDCRAHVERMTRQLARLEGLPPGERFPLVVNLWRLGDAIWVLLPGEHYQYLQKSLRARFPHQTVVVSTVTGGWSPGYVPTADCYSRGIYQESIALVAPGSLEFIAQQIGDWLAEMATSS